MINITNKTKCCGCSACVNICPTQCILMKMDTEGFLYPKANEDKCIHCGLCESVCSFTKTEPVQLSCPESYAVKIKNTEIREKSSSGGIFSVLACRILYEGGVIYGAAMREDNKSVHHIRVDSFESLEALRTSKYLQSEMTDVYQQVLADLNVGKKVLFSGVPCQINGLKLFLRKEYVNLFCVEVICHGVPSPALWRKYADHLEGKYEAKIQNVNFRSKKHGWNKSGLTIEGQKIQQYKSTDTDPYMKMFLRNYCLRPSCYDCNAKNLESMADITIADFWGIRNVAPDFYDDAGVSLVLLQSQKGTDLFQEIKDEIDFIKVDFEQAIKANPSYSKSVSRPFQRESFFSDMNAMSFRDLEKKYASDTFKTKCKNVIKKSFLWKILLKITHRDGADSKN